MRASGSHGERSKFFLPDPRDFTDVTLVNDDGLALEAQNWILVLKISLFSTFLWQFFPNLKFNFSRTTIFNDLKFSGYIHDYNIYSHHNGFFENHFALSS